MSKNCPFCGNPDCLTTQELDKSWWLSGPCKDRQIANLKKQVAKLEQQCQSMAAHAVMDDQKIADLTEILEVWRDLADIVRPMDELLVVQRLEEMGEL